MPHLEERGGRKMTIGEVHVCPGSCTPRPGTELFAGANLVAHMKNKAVPTSFLELPVGRENSIYS